MALVSMNPATGELIKEFRSWSEGETYETVEKVYKAGHSWRQTSFTERIRLALAMAAVLRRQKEDLASMITLEMGKPISEARAEVEKCALLCDYYAEHAKAFLSNEDIESGAGKSYVRFDPLGTILAVMPWNFPLWQVFRFSIPALMAGNTVLLKHASNTTWCALSIEGLFASAGFPENIFRSLMIGSGDVAGVIRDRRIAGVTLTGSSKAGQAVAQTAGASLKKTVLELGGSDPFIVLPDADIGQAVEAAVTSRMINAGQSCVAAKRFIVEKTVMDKFLEGFKSKMEALVIGDPIYDSTQVGPMARMDLRDSLHQQVQKSIELGAKALTGGGPIDGPGAFYQPTILVDVKPGMPAYDEEMFGPVASVIVAGNTDEAIETANDTDYGLGASIWTADSELAEALAARIEAGAVFINGFVKSDPRLPFGGIKDSGYGRELSIYGIREFVNIKTVWMR